MSPFLKHYPLKYTPLSPVHIGTDESYEPGNYVIDEGALYYFDTMAAMQSLTANDRQQLLSIINSKADDNLLTRVQAFFNQHKEKLIANANPAIPTAAGVHALYENRIGRTAQQESRGKRVINKLEIERTFYNPINNFPLLPGSSIKGAIRTAMLDNQNQGKALAQRYEKNKDLQTRLFSNGQFHSDPFRLISIADANWQDSIDRPSRNIQFAVNRKRKAVTKDGIMIQSQAEASNLYQLLECIMPYHYQSFNGNISIHVLNGIKHDSKKLPAPHLQWSITDIAKACNRFYMKQLLQELDAMKKRKFIALEWYRLIEQDLVSRITNNEAFLIRLGRHSGAEALTLENIRSIKINQGKKNNPTYEKQPKTWWFAANQINAQHNLLPFGWVLVEIVPTNKNARLQQSLEKSTELLKAWLQEKNDKQITLRQTFLKQREREQAQELEYLQKKQEELAQKKAEEQRLAALRPIDREIEEFLKPIQAQDRDTRLLNELSTGRWEGEDAKTVALKVKELMETAGKWIPDFTGSNKKKKKLQERCKKVLKYIE